MTMLVTFILQNSPMMEKLFRIPDLVAGNLCPTLLVVMNNIDVGQKVGYESIVNDRALLHLTYTVTRIESGCIAWLNLKNYQIKTNYEQA